MQAEICRLESCRLFELKFLFVFVVWLLICPPCGVWYGGKDMPFLFEPCVVGKFPFASGFLFSAMPLYSLSQENWLLSHALKWRLKAIGLGGSLTTPTGKFQPFFVFHGPGIFSWTTLLHGYIQSRLLKNIALVACHLHKLSAKYLRKSSLEKLFTKLLN